MKKDWLARELTMEIVVGAFVVMIFLGLGYFTIILSRETWFGTKFPMTVEFKDVMGLREGDSVVVRGMPVGKIKRLHLEDGRVHVHALLNEPVALHEGYRITIIATSILGGRYMDVREGPLDAPELAADGLFHGEVPYDLITDAAELVNAAKTRLIDGGVLENLQATAEDLRGIAGRLNRGEGTLGKLLSSDETLYNDFSKIVSEARAITERLNRGEGTLGRLLSSDDQFYLDLAASAEAVRAISHRLEKGEGTLGRLLSSDDELYRDLSETVSSLKTVVQRVENGEGLIGGMLKDDGLYEDVRATVQEVRAAIDDMRETTPVVTFTSIFFGAF